MYVGQQRVVKALAHAHATSRLPHALLFVGPQGCGRYSLAIRTAAAFFCTGGRFPLPCEACATCRRVFAGNHPDVLRVAREAYAIEHGWMQPEGSKRAGLVIRVDQIRELARALRLRGFEGATRVAIIKDAHLMNDNAANALLKTLEEPGDDTLIILTAPHERAVLPTIRSRCSIMRFAPLATGDVRRVLDHLGVEDAEARAAAADGSVSRALEADLSDRSARQERAGGFLDAVRHERGAALLDAVEAQGKDRDEAQRLLDDVQRTLAAQIRTKTAAGEAVPARDLALVDAIDAAREVIRENNAHVQLTLEELALLRAL